MNMGDHRAQEGRNEGRRKKEGGRKRFLGVTYESRASEAPHEKPINNKIQKAAAALLTPLGTFSMERQ
jgi:hypothetical protein